MGKKSTEIDISDPKFMSQKQRTKLKNKLQELKNEKNNEDLKWKETDKNAIKKQLRKEERDLKKFELNERKKLLKNKAELELEEIEKSVKKQPSNFVPRVTLAQINESQKITGKAGRTSIISSLDTSSENIEAKSVKNVVKQTNVPLENVNRINSDAIVASTIDDAINVLSNLVGNVSVDNVNSHSGPVNLKAKSKSSVLFSNFKQRELSRLKREYPSLKYSQINQMIVKLWTKSSENPANFSEQ